MGPAIMVRLYGCCGCGCCTPWPPSEARSFEDWADSVASLSPSSWCCASKAVPPLATMLRVAVGDRGPAPLFPGPDGAPDAEAGAAALVTGVGASIVVSLSLPAPSFCAIAAAI